MLPRFPVTAKSYAQWLHASMSILELYLVPAELWKSIISAAIPQEVLPEFDLCAIDKLVDAKDLEERMSKSRK